MPSRYENVWSGSVPHDGKARLQSEDPLRVLFDAKVLLDVFCQRENTDPAARCLTFAELDAVNGFVWGPAFVVICHCGATLGPGRATRERRLAKQTMRLLTVLPLTEEVRLRPTCSLVLDFDRPTTTVGGWTREHTDRHGFLLDDGCSIRRLTLLESLLQYRLASTLCSKGSAIRDVD